MLGLAFVLFAANYVLSRFLGFYYPFIVLPVGPLITLGGLVVISPWFLDVLFSDEEKKNDSTIKKTSYIFLAFGGLISVFMFAKLRGEL